mmetsp:Transcript_7958/g.10169  ORF Transcript_7958/g.10169 Transcript_7958/m.10169 type:complete len:239 (-) Transcript_7958:63-779(-)
MSNERNLLPFKRKYDEYFSIAIDECAKCLAAVARGEGPSLSAPDTFMNVTPSMEHSVKKALSEFKTCAQLPKDKSKVPRTDAGLGLKILSEASEQVEGDQGGASGKIKQAVDASKLNVKPFKSETPFNNGTFPFILHDILSRPEYDHIISWRDHGRAWKVHNTNELAKILPKFLRRQTKYSSFVRQVNLWGFKRVTFGYDMGSYYHKHFIRSQPILCRQMVRKKSIPRKKEIPDFYVS